MDNESFIKRTLVLASRARGDTSPNPMVGAILVKDGVVIAQDYHKRPGSPHAEALVLDKAGIDTRDSTLYVNLEPCCHTEKRTPPCAQAIIKAGIREVFVAMRDPNPMVAGKGLAMLREAGITVHEDILTEKARRLNESYIKFITEKRPFVTLKLAMTLDGKIATPTGNSKWITSERSRKMVHGMRSRSDALLSAIGTVLADNPEFTARYGYKKNPVRVIIDPEQKTPDDFKILKTPPRTILVARSGSPREETLISRGIEIISYEDRLDLDWLLQRLGGMNISSLMIEGGSALAGHALEEEIVDKLMVFIAPKIIGGRDSIPAVGGSFYRDIPDALRLKDMKIRRIDTDIIIEGYLK